MANMLKRISGALSLIFWFSSFFVWHYFDAYRPKAAQPENGRVFLLNTHGSVVYLTSGEHTFLYGLIAFGIVFFVLGAVLHGLGTSGYWKRTR